MHRCSCCDQVVESRQDKLQRHVFAWTFMTLCVWGSAIPNAEWSAQWWQARWHLVAAFAGVTAVAVYFWVQLLRERRQRKAAGEKG